MVAVHLESTIHFDFLGSEKALVQNLPLSCVFVGLEGLFRQGLELDLALVINT